MGATTYQERARGARFSAKLNLYWKQNLVPGGLWLMKAPFRLIYTVSCFLVSDSKTPHREAEIKPQHWMGKF